MTNEMNETNETTQEISNEFDLGVEESTEDLLGTGFMDLSQFDLKF